MTKRTKSKPKTKPNVKSHRTKKRNCRKFINKTKKRKHSHQKTKKKNAKPVKNNIYVKKNTIKKDDYSTR